jgi:RNA polymerase sigma-70 factor, ECF subfamily
VPVEFEQLFDEVYPSLFRYCHRLVGDGDVADDAAQEAFVRLHRGGVTGPPPALRVWLFRVATRLIQDRGRALENRRRLLDGNPVHPSGVPDPEIELERSETVARVRRVLDTLEGRDRELLLMREEGFSYREMADVVGVAPGSVGTLLARAQRRFTLAFEEVAER